MTQDERDRIFGLFRKEISTVGVKTRKRKRRKRKKERTPYDGRYMEEGSGVLYARISDEAVVMFNILCEDYGLDRRDVLDMIIRKFVKNMRDGE